MIHDRFDMYELYQNPEVVRPINNPICNGSSGVWSVIRRFAAYNLSRPPMPGCSALSFTLDLSNEKARSPVLFVQNESQAQPSSLV